MIYQLALRHSRKIAFGFLLLFECSLTIPTLAQNARPIPIRWRERSFQLDSGFYFSDKPQERPVLYPGKKGNYGSSLHLAEEPAKKLPEDIGGPSQPEMSSFKSVGTDNMVNLFSGDFSYNIPLLDVSGYPVNIYYDGGISPEQEASWVGLGWNLNPGSVARNVRGVPDDFNGQDLLVQTEKIKPNKTWGLTIGGDVEIFGQKGFLKEKDTAFTLKAGASLGVAFNNYLGPSLDLAIRRSASYNIAKFAGSEKFSLSPSLSVNTDLNSRSGASFAGQVSLTARLKMKHNYVGFGGGLSTSYNSRSGIRSLQLYEQNSFSYDGAKKGSTSNLRQGSFGQSLLATSITFLKPSYTPALRMPMTNTAWSGHFQYGFGINGVATDIEAEVYGQKSEIADSDVVQRKPMVGYLYSQNAANNPDYVMDFTRFNDREVTPNTPIISVPQYSYDVFSIQGEGTGGSIRAYRNDLGYVRDNQVVSKDKNLTLGVDIDPPGHYGANLNTIKTPSVVGEWGNGNTLRANLPFQAANGSFENVYFRNPGENCVIDSNRFNKLGGTDLVRFVLSGDGKSPVIETTLQRFDKAGSQTTQSSLIGNPTFPVRNRRTQIVNFLTAEEATVAGLDTMIKSYNNQTFLNPSTRLLLYDSIKRVSSYRRPYHISQINVTEGNGRRYIYGIPVYNVIQKDFAFSVSGISSANIPDRVPVADSNLMLLTSTLFSNDKIDAHVNITQTPPYAHSFLLTGILSPDYVDVTRNGITEDDLGDAVKFNYTRIRNGNDTLHGWRTPLTPLDSANFNPGTRSETKDDKAIITYGARESWYLQSVESKTMIALFYTSPRFDAIGPVNEYGRLHKGDNLTRRLDSISLFSKPDLKANGLTSAKAIKTVHFDYSYQLCKKSPDNSNVTDTLSGKLTLARIYFTYNGKTRAFKNNYRFYYTSTGKDTASENPNYSPYTFDRWGNYKPSSLNPGGLKNSDYPWTIQDTSQRKILNQNAAAWMLKTIVLPSGGQIEVNYESDDYAFVQNRRAAEMMRVIGFGSSSSFASASDRLYPFNFPSQLENDYIFARVPEACATATDVYNKYLSGMTQLCLKLWVIMPKGPEYLTCYATIQSWGVDISNPRIIWVKMARLSNRSPLSNTALEYLRQQLPGQAYQGYDVSEQKGLKQIGEMLAGMIKARRNAFTDPINVLREDGKAMHTDTSKCFVRLNDPDGYKYGGGHRVKSVILRDNWNRMTGQFTSSYGQKYDYTTTEQFNGSTRRISSGVASYEPAIGNEENPFSSIIQVQDDFPAGPTSYGAIEMPVMDAFFPAPMVGYSKVTVSSIRFDTLSSLKSRSGIGKQVTEYYTAKD